MNTKLQRIADIAKENPKEKFSALIHHVNKEMLMQCHKELKGNKAQYFYLKNEFLTVDHEVYSLDRRIYERLKEKEEIMLDAIENNIFEE